MGEALPARSGPLAPSSTRRSRCACVVASLPGGLTEEEDGFIVAAAAVVLDPP